MSRLTFRGHKGYGLLKGKSCSYASHSFDCQLDEGVKLLDAAFEKLTQYEDLEEQGRLIELPCKVGDIVYAPIDFENKIFEGKVKSFEYNDIKKCWLVKISTSKGLCYEKIRDFGKKIFISYKEAEKALKK